MYVKENPYIFNRLQICNEVSSRFSSHIKSSMGLLSGIWKCAVALREF